MPWFTPLCALAAPSPSSVTSQGLGFGPLTAERAALDLIPQAVVAGFQAAGAARDLDELGARLELLDPTLRGFGYEGATMAFTILDALSGGRRTRSLLQGPGRPHVLLCYIGMGFAMRRLPRALWSRVLPDLDISPYHPTMSWLAVDGYGFDLAYFHADRYVHQQQRPDPWPWLGFPQYFPRAVDQGVGRALWFVAGAQPVAVARLVTRFAPERRADLWSGVGLAATFAGPTTKADVYHALRDLAGTYDGDLALGCALAGAARVAAGTVPAHCDVAAQALTGRDVAALAAEADRAAVLEDAGVPAYERWRARLSGRLVEAGDLRRR